MPTDMQDVRGLQRSREQGRRRGVLSGKKMCLIPEGSMREARRKAIHRRSEPAHESGLTEGESPKRLLAAILCSLDTIQSGYHGQERFHRGTETAPHREAGCRVRRAERNWPPDSIADGLAESVSRALCKMYKERYGRILHHNTDEVEVVGGQSAPVFGGGSMLEPIYILLVGRATTEVNGLRLPYRTCALKAAYSYLEKNCKNLDVEWDVTLDCRIGQGSVDLRGLYETQRLLANDTSFGVGFARSARRSASPLRPRSTSTGSYGRLSLSSEKMSR